MKSKKAKLYGIDQSGTFQIAEFENFGYALQIAIQIKDFGQLMGCTALIIEAGKGIHKLDFVTNEETNEIEMKATFKKIVA